MQRMEDGVHGVGDRVVDGVHGVGDRVVDGAHGVGDRVVVRMLFGEGVGGCWCMWCGIGVSEDGVGLVWC